MGPVDGPRRRRGGTGPEPVFAPHDVIATFERMTDARRAIQAVQMAGVDASQISLYGPAADEAAADLDVRDADARFTGEMWRRTWIGSIVGFVLGVAVGVVGAWWSLRGVGPGTTAVFWAAVVGMAVLGLGTGAATGAASAAQMSRAWELTFHTVAPGAVGVAVHTARVSEARRIEAVLQRHRPIQLERFEVDPTDPGDPPPEPVRT